MTRPGWLGRSLARRDLVATTMEECVAACRAGAPDGHVVVARRQSAGRGRTGRAWHSADEGGLYLSLLLRGFADARAAAGLTLAAGIGVSDAARTLGVPDLALKWPNDLLAGGRKLAGILTEWLPEGAAVVGVGFNAAQERFPDDLAALAVSASLAAGRPISTDEALAALLAALEAAFDSFRLHGLAWIVPEWSSRSGLWGRRARAAGVEGVMVRLDPDGALVVRLDDGSIRRVTADVVDLL
jgi:BirA family biotin operon repressor/biotin-[acetyl-CoA-carboxylase] ligase